MVASSRNNGLGDRSSLSPVRRPNKGWVPGGGEPPIAAPSRVVGEVSNPAPISTHFVSLPREFTRQIGRQIVDLRREFTLLAGFWSAGA